ncbi:MAG: hypothetical protein CMK09_13835 [Ponticaulis sp.]|nr:hypothetical protein [Ponticaulis sp.]
MLKHLLSTGVAVSILAACTTLPTTENSGTSSEFSERLQTPRIPPVDPADPSLTQAQKYLLESRTDFNLYKTLAHHPDLYNSWSPMGRFILSGSSIPPRYREIVMLRMGWLCQAEYEWSQHARIAQDDVGFTDEEIRAVAIGVDAGNWDLIEQTLIRMVDDLRYDAAISDEVWGILVEEFTEREIMEMVYTAGQYQLVSMVLNSTGIQLDPVLRHKLPTDLPLPPLAGKADPPREQGDRLEIVSLADMSDEQTAAVTPFVRNGQLANLMAMLVKNPQLMKSHLGFLAYLNGKSELTDRMRELAILRTVALLGVDYEWSYHSKSALASGLSEDQVNATLVGSTAAGWSDEDAAILRAAEDLRREAFITDETWAEMSEFMTQKQKFELVFLIGGYSLTGLTINAFGVPLDDGRTGIPG